MERNPVGSAALRMEAKRDHCAIVPEGIQTAASFPSSAAIRASRRCGETALAVVVDLVDRGRALGERQERRPRVAVARVRRPTDALALRPDVSLIATLGHVESVRADD